MALQDLILETDKRINNINEDKVIVRQSEKGLVLTATILKPDGTKYDLSNHKVQFGESKDGDKIVIDEDVEIDSSNQGVIHYTMNQAVYAASGEAWFEIFDSNNNVIDTTQNFYVQVMPQATIHITNDNYVSSLQAEINHFKANNEHFITAANQEIDSLQSQIQQSKELTEKSKQDALNAIQEAKDTATATLNNLNGQYSSYASKYEALESKINSDIKSINDHADSQINSIKADWDKEKQAAESDRATIRQNGTDEINSIKSDWSKQTDAINADAKTKIDAAIATVETARDTAIKQAVSDFSNQRDNLQADYNSWKQDTVNDFNSQLATLQGKIDAETTQQSDLKAAIDSARAAVDKIADVDFTKFAHKDDVDKALKSIDFGKIAFRKQYTINSDGDTSYKTWSANKQTDGTWLIDLSNDDWTAANTRDALSTSRSNEDKINQLNTRFDKYSGNQAVKNADANAITTSGTYFIDSPGNNFPIDHWGVLVVNQANENGNIRLEQTFYPDDNSSPCFRTMVDNNWKSWCQLASKEDIGDLKSKIDSNDQATIVTGYDWSDGNSTSETKIIQQTQLVDQQVLKGAVDRMNNLQNQINDRATNSTVNIAAPLFRKISNANTWQDILGVANGNQVLVSIRDEAGGNTIGNFSSAIAFGGGDTKGVLNVSYADHTARIIGGNSDRPQWHEDIAWKSDINNLNNRFNGYDSRIGNLEHKIDGLTPFTIITQAQYDKLTEAQKQSGTYGISG